LRGEYGIPGHQGGSRSEPTTPIQRKLSEKYDKKNLQKQWDAATPEQKKFFTNKARQTFSAFVKAQAGDTYKDFVGRETNFDPGNDANRRVAFYGWRSTVEQAIVLGIKIPDSVMKDYLARGDNNYDLAMDEFEIDELRGKYGILGHRGGSSSDPHGAASKESSKKKPLNKTTLHTLADQMVAADAAGEEAGFSYQSETEDLNPATGFMSSEYEDLNEAIPIGEFNDRRLIKYAIKNKEYFRDHNLYLGGWVSGGDVYLDVSQRFTGKVEALQSAIDNFQLGIFDLSTKKTIYTSSKFDPQSPNYDKAIEQAFKNKQIPFPGP
jgi:hypothetical protein